MVNTSNLVTPTVYGEAKSCIMHVSCRTLSAAAWRVAFLRHVVKSMMGADPVVKLTLVRSYRLRTAADCLATTKVFC